jgi:hypothetical protein
MNSNAGYFEGLLSRRLHYRSSKRRWAGRGACDRYSLAGTSSAIGRIGAELRLGLERRVAARAPKEGSKAARKGRPAVQQRHGASCGSS